MSENGSDPAGSGYRFEQSPEPPTEQLNLGDIEYPERVEDRAQRRGREQHELPKAPAFEVTEVWGELKKFWLFRTIIGLIGLVRDLVAGVLGFGRVGFRWAHGNRVRLAEGAESYTARLRRWLGGVVTVYLLEVTAEGRKDRSARRVYAVDLSSELASGPAYGQPAIVIGRFDRVRIMRRSENLLRDGRLTVKLLRREHGQMFRVADAFGSRLTLTPGALLLLIAHYNGEREIFLSELVTQAIRRGENAGILAELAQDLMGELRARSN